MCETCGSGLTQPITGRRRRFCSRGCQLSAHRSARAAGKVDRWCTACGERIPATRRADTSCCSERCARQLRDRRRGVAAIPNAVERFWARVERDEVTGCWNWKAARLASGYGSLRVDNRAVVVHRFAWELLRGRIPDGLQVDHLCFNRLCCNPNHLEPVTQQENLRRARQRPASPSPIVAAQATPPTKEKS